MDLRPKAPYIFSSVPLLNDMGESCNVCKRFELNFCKVILFSYAGKITMTLTVDPEFKGDVFAECPPDIFLRTPFFGNGDFWIEIRTLLYAIRILKSGDEQVSERHTLVGSFSDVLKLFFRCYT